MMNEEICLSAERAKQFGVPTDGKNEVTILPLSINENDGEIVIDYSVVNETTENNQTKKIIFDNKNLNPYQSTFVGWVYLTLYDYKNDYKDKAKPFLQNAIRAGIESCLPYFLLWDKDLIGEDPFVRFDLYHGLEKKDVFPEYYSLIARKEENPFKAKSLIEEGWNKFPKDASLTERYASNLIKGKKFEECLTVIKNSQPFEGVVHHFDYDRLISFKYESHTGLKQFDKAESTITDSDLDDSEKSLFVGILFYRQKKYTEAAEHFIKTLESARTGSNTIQAGYYFLLCCYEKNKDIKNVAEIVKLLPENPSEFYIIPYDLDYRKLAEGVLRTVIKEPLGEIAIAKAKGCLAVVIFAKYLSDIDGRALTGKEQKYVEEGLLLIRESLIFHPDNSYFNAIASNYHSLNKDYEDSVLYGFRSLYNKKADNYFVDTVNDRLAKCSDDFLEEYAEKLKMIADESMFSVDKYVAEWLPYDIHTLLKKKKYKTIAELFSWVKETENWIEVARKIQAADTDIYTGGLFEIAYSYNEIGDRWEAKKLYCYIIDTGEQNSSVLNNLAMIYEKNGDLEEAKKNIRKAKDILAGQSDGIVERNYLRLVGESKITRASNKDVQNKTNKSKVIKPEFNANTGEIILGIKNCFIPIGTNQYQLCKAIFVKPLGEWVTETDVSDDFNRGTNGNRAFYDAIRLVNKRVAKDIKIKNLIEFKAASARIRKESFE